MPIVYYWFFGLLSLSWREDYEASTLGCFACLSIQSFTHGKSQAAVVQWVGLQYMSRCVYNQFVMLYRLFSRGMEECCFVNWFCQLLDICDILVPTGSTC